MHEGAFALIDCLGFKGIWRRTDPELLIQKLSQIERTVHDEITAPAGGSAFKHLSFGPIRLNVRLLSDTVAISLQYEEQAEKAPEEWQKNFLVGIICQAVIQVLDLFLKSEPHLVLRGCISYGEHISEGNFIAGPAVDEAAEHMNIAEGAFVWLLPPAEERYMRMMIRTYAMLQLFTPEHVVTTWEVLKKRGVKEVDSALDAAEKFGAEAAAKVWLSTIIPIINAPIVIFSYEMPLKTGARLRCAVLNPLAHQRGEEERHQSIKTYSNIISGNRLDIWLKHQHTIDFLKVADEKCAAFDKEMSSLKAGESQVADEEPSSTHGDVT